MTKNSNVIKYNYEFAKPKTCKVLLFDIDGTLLSTEKAGFEALDKAFKDVLNSKLGLYDIKLDGNTDLNAIKQVCRRENIKFPDHCTLSLFIEVYSTYLDRLIRNKGHLKPGVYDLLKYLNSQSNYILGLVTGNFRKGAYIKLARFNIAKYFKIGSFGCESSKRENLIRLAINKAIHYIKSNYQDSKNADSSFGNLFDTIVIGDTPNDILAAQQVGVKVLAVATGNYSFENLQKYNPTWVLHNLGNLQKVIEIFEK